MSEIKSAENNHALNYPSVFPRRRITNRIFFMLVIIDNYDSFTFNLVQYFGELGEKLLVFRNDKVSINELEDLNPDYLVISPGPCTPSRAGISEEVITEFAGKTPILGVCLGHQAIGEAFGGKIIKAPEPVHGKLSNISHDGKGIFKDISNPFKATRYHSLIIERESLPDDLEVSATADDLIMGVRHKKFAIDGIQFHPESIMTDEGLKMLGNFINKEPS